MNISFANFAGPGKIIKLLGRSGGLAGWNVGGPL
jgi:hypothetical protein